MGPNRIGTTALFQIQSQFRLPKDKTLVDCRHPLTFSCCIYMSMGGDHEDGVPKQIGLFHPNMGLDVSCTECSPVQWISGHVPVATRIIKYRINTIDPAAFYTMTLLAAMGIVLAFICLSFNLAKRKLKYGTISAFYSSDPPYSLIRNARYIKLSSPKLNNIAIVGTVLVYGAVFLLGIDHATLVHESYYPAVCTVIAL